MWVALAALCAALPLGVRPGDERFSGQGDFSCAGKTVPQSAINDDYCDCEDGADEPGTSACAGLPTASSAPHFYCPNENAAARYVFATRVNDGVCDCCDGSDEWATKHCPNTCHEDGRKDREKVAQKKDAWLRGLAVRKQHVAAAKGLIEGWKLETEKIKAREAALGTEIEAVRAELAAAEEKVKALGPEAPKEPEPAAEEAGEEFDDEEEAPDPEDEAGEKPVSEYAKWMDEEGKKEAGVQDTKEPVSEYAKWMDAEGKKEAGLEDDGPTKGPMERIKDAAAGAVEAVKSVFDNRSPEVKERDEIKEKVTKLESEKRDGQKRVKELEEHLSMDWGEENEYIMLHKKECLKQHFGEYDYHICFLGEAKQGHTDLGSFESLETVAGVGDVMKFTGGATCPGGIQRAMTVVLRCGDEPRMLNVKEPSMCSYKADVTYPGACTQDALDELLKVQPKHPTEL